ncbi:MAG: PAS domain S-box protein, partial [Cyanobacteria bacterium P01_D01_bin.2]
MVGAVGVRPLLDSVLNERVAPDYAIAGRAGDTEIYRRTPDSSTDDRWSQRTRIELHGLLWELEVWPTPVLLAQEQSLLPPVILISGLLLAGLSAWVVGLSQTSQNRQRRLLAETNERQRAEQDLERFFNLSVDLLCIAGTDGYFKRVNPAFETTLGYSEDVLLSQSFLSFVHPDDRAATLAELDSLAAGKPTRSFENRYRCRDGTYRWLHWATFPIVETGLLCAVARDTTDRRATEENVKRFSTHLKHLHRLNTTHYESFDALFADCLDIGCQILGLETGIISQIVDQTYTIRSLRTNLALVVGQEFPLANTYCAAVVKAQQTVTYGQVGTMANLRGHPAYQTLHIESYLGTPIWVNETIYGTLNFSSTQVRPHAFSRHEQEIVELMAQSIGRF